MSEEINSGCPAFPTRPNTQQGYYAHDGMSLRDWFAGQALAGMLADPNVCGLASDIAQGAYGWADAMLKAREATSHD